jgi:hypothetical protein
LDRELRRKVNGYVLFIGWLLKLVNFNAGIKSLHTTLPDEIFTGDFAS